MALLGRAKAAAVTALTTGPVAGLLRPLMREAAVVFMLHRFTDPDRGISGDDPARVREMLAWLRRERYHLLSLPDLLRHLAAGSVPAQAVVFTLDDGYAEQADVAGPLFAEFDCPVTTFVATGFLDRALWFWWDQIEYVFTHSTRARVTAALDGLALTYDLPDAASRRAAQAAFTAHCKTVPETHKLAWIRALAAAADVAVPAHAPERYAPMTWDELRACERRGMTFGPHTVTHPILARADDVQAQREIVESWARLRSEARVPAAVFAYPNGQHADFSARDFAVLREQGLAAVTGVAGFATARRFRAPDGPLVVPRFAFPDSVPYLGQIVGGLERLKFLLRKNG